MYVLYIINIYLFFLYKSLYYVQSIGEIIDYLKTISGLNKSTCNTVVYTMWAKRRICSTKSAAFQ